MLVYDYKSGAADPVGATFLTGQRLQLFIYLLALQQACGADRTARPAGVFLAPLYPDLRVLENRYAAEAEPAAQVMYMYRPRGLVAEEAARRLDHELGPVSSPVAQMKLKQDGAFYANCDARPGPQVEQRLELAQRTVVQAAEGITRGCIDVAPLSEKHTLACRVCDFAAVCRYDPAYNRARAAEAVLPKLAGPGADEGADE